MCGLFTQKRITSLVKKSIESYIMRPLTRAGGSVWWLTAGWLILNSQYITTNVFYPKTNPINSHQAAINTSHTNNIEIFKQCINEQQLNLNCSSANYKPAIELAELTEVTAGDEGEKNDFILVAGIPKFEDFLSHESIYSFHYKVVQFGGVDLVNEHDEDGDTIEVSVAQLDEYFERDNNKGRIVIGTGEDTTELYIDGQAKAIYWYSLASDVCKRVGSIKPLISSKVLTPRTNTQFDSKAGYALGALWIQLQQETKDVHLKIRQQQDDEGNLVELRTYKGTLFKATWTQQTHEATVFFDFKSRANYTSQTSESQQVDTIISGENYQLTSVRILPKLDWRNQDPAHHANIFLDLSSIGPKKAREWELPEKCVGISPNSPNSTNQFGFPMLTDMISESHRFYMRSEITVTRQLKLVFDSDINFFLMDEWLYDNKLRMQTQGLKTKNLDLLLYGRTKEVFDLSKAYKCTNQLPANIDQPTFQSNFVEFWSDDTTMINSLFHLYYSPLSLWRLAERNLVNIELVSDVELAPKPRDKGEDKKNSTKRKSDPAKEFRSEIWRVTKPTASERLKWSYDMHFERFSQQDDQGNKLREWVVLDRIEIREPEIIGAGRVIEIDIVNYDWNQRDEKFVEKFLLPEGFGCKRTTVDDASSGGELVAKVNDELDVDIDNDHQLVYEATLELFELEENSQLGSASNVIRRKLPTLSGTFYRGHSLSLGGINLYSHLARIRMPDGSTKSTKQVFDRRRTVLYDIDRLKGVCKISFGQPTRWQLDFPLTKEAIANSASSKSFVEEQQSAVVSLDHQLIDQLFVGTEKQNFRLLNQYSLGNREFVTYEQFFDNIWLSDKISKPAMVIRKFHNIKGQHVRESQGKSGTSSSRLRDSVAVKVIVFNEKERDSLRAIFSINLLSARNIAPEEVLNAINVAQCYNDGSVQSDKSSASFVIEYRAQGSLAGEKYVSRQRIEQQFIVGLMKSTKILMTQFNGSPKVEFSLSSSIVRLHFNLLDAPSAFEYFRKKTQMSLDQELRVKSDFKLMADIRACSSWCDQLECVTMTFCFDHTCSIVSANQIDSNYNSSVYKLDYYLEQHAMRKQDCDYYYKADLKAPTLNKINALLDKTINQGQDQISLRQLSLFINQESVLPSRFYQINQNFASDNEQSSSFPEIPTSSENLQQSDKEELNAYKVFRLDTKINVAKLRELAKNENSRVFDMVEHAFGFSQCIDRCKSLDCLLVSFCGEISVCTMILGKNLDLRELEVKTMEQVDKNQTCSVSVKDITLKYTRFEHTQKPQKSKLELENYSAVECASLCDATNANTTAASANFTCLSFDSCTFYGGEQERNVCYLQQVHVMQDNFDREILKRKLNDAENREMFCEHYSKSQLADFERIPNSEVAKSSTVLRALDEEKCAYDCLQDDDCGAFEFCVDRTKQPSQSCYLIRNFESSSTSAVGVKLNQKEFNEKLKKVLSASKTCSVYTLRHEIEFYNFKGELLTEVEESLTLNEQLSHQTTIIWLLVTFGYLVIALVIGFVLQNVYHRFNSIFVSN